MQGKNAIVTGGSRGVGKGIALELASRGANVLITYASAKTQAEDVSREIQALGVDCVAVAAAGTDHTAPKTIVDAAIQKWGVIDILVNNAAAGDEFTLLETTDEQFETQIAINLRFSLFLIKEAVPHFGRAPRIVNMSSMYSRSGHAGCLVYSACTGGMESATRSLARELGHKYNATVNCVMPGPVNTDLWAKAISNPEAQEAWKGPIRDTPAAPRIAEPDDVAQIVAFLCEERSRWTTGSVVNATGGMLFV
ncbi:Gluconate 5-dehydrogenase [Neofusicoccum parvum]|uniref:Gluconate 5-dehydrogenase n=1 Tax=Neofusicoccum parvum TaxID=310453 RepID=A0ACB5SB06_9PEZI|nr:Gluconate 5-dehydrogenase [Neofusicoccum parvum]